MITCYHLLNSTLSNSYLNNILPTLCLITYSTNNHARDPPKHRLKQAEPKTVIRYPRNQVLKSSLTRDNPFSPTLPNSTNNSKPKSINLNSPTRTFKTNSRSRQINSRISTFSCLSVRLSVRSLKKSIKRF